jgi:hypothetical protein
MGTWRTQQSPWSWLIGFILLLALVLRCYAALRLTAHIDEASTLLAIHRVAEIGLPILPSGSAYFQGATLSYLLTPLHWLGWADITGDLTLLRLPEVIAGTAAVWLTYVLGSRVSGNARVGTLAALLLALDPISVQWSAHVRMYAPLQALSLGLILTFLSLLTGPPRRRRLVLFVALWWIAIFTHVSAALLLPAMGLIALRVHGRSLLSGRRDLILALGLGAAAAGSLLGINALFGQARAGTEATAPLPWIRFVGDHVIDLGALTEIDLTLWRSLFLMGEQSRLASLPPLFIIGASLAIVVGWLPLGRRLNSHREIEYRVVTGALLACYWLPVLIVSAVATSPRPRYLLLVQPLSYIILASAAVSLRWNWNRRETSFRFVRHASLAVPGAVALLLLVHLGRGLVWLGEHPVVMPNYVNALSYVNLRHQPGELVLVSMPSPAYLVLSDVDDLRYLAGPDDRPPGQSRVERYTRLAPNGQRIDYWIGVGAIASTAELCETFINNPDAWLVLEDARHLNHGWAYGGDMAEVITGMTVETYRAPGGAVVRRAQEVSLSNHLRQLCGIRLATFENGFLGR